MGSPSVVEVGDRGSMWDLEQKFDQSMDEEADKIGNMHGEKKVSTLLILRLAFQSLGVVFGDLGTSPLYVFYNTFSHGVKDPEDIIGALSLIIYTLTLIPLLKYVFVVLRANDNGQGGTFALYSLLCRHAKINDIPNQHRSDEKLTTYSCRTYEENSLPAKFKNCLEAHAYKRKAILVLVLIGTCTAIGDGVLTPAISVLSATGGIKVNQPNVSNDVVILVAVIILIGLFSMQHYGADRVSWVFAPVVLLWFLFIGFIGAFNLWKYDSSVLKAFNPAHIFKYFKCGRQNWTFLSGIMLSITGSEALFADLCNFPVPAIQIAFSFVVFPCLLLAYIGQAAYIIQHQDQVFDAFYRSIPDCVYWPMFVIATAAAIIASQATVSATFSIIKQALALGCFPRVKVVHTSENFLGQIYIPDINWIMMILCIAVSAGFKNQNHIGNAYGTAAVIVMLVTTLLMVPIMFLVWRSHWILIILFTGLSLFVELAYFSAVLFKVDEGGWVPLVIAAVFFLIMYDWHYVTVKRYEFEMHSRVSMAWIHGLSSSLGLVRVPGIGFIYTELPSGLPRIFSHLITNLPALHSVVVFVCVKYLPVYRVPLEERFLVKRIGPKNFHIFRCVVRYGYKDLHKKDDDFEKMLFDSIVVFVHHREVSTSYSDLDDCDFSVQQNENSFDLVKAEYEDDLCSLVEVTNISLQDSIPVQSLEHNSDITEFSTDTRTGSEDELDILTRCKEAGVVHILGNTRVRAQRNSNIFKRIAVDYVYAFLKRGCRENSMVFNLPHESLLTVGQDQKSGMMIGRV
ncbi:probable potassium transporter 11 isoform X2 [Phalaenopsis equestris]|uniref:probable potassium transporter 11 isoform X2 n=1 Tax=Phalaenopsis equestris TaxID=78828 RepID=UPI0009E2C6D5|nr:probable potassium transporter 11 isoform X2 [Phalaenopsis equestris]